ncbi:MAG: nucleotidyltransferase family protein [archaeon]|nr:nucleotidyltransferase family protein [archaeon]
MKALILAAGYAKRLWPLTKNRPKPLLEVKGKPIIEHIISQFKDIPEIDEVFVVTNEKFSLTFEQWADEFDSKLPIKIINDMTTSNEDRMGAVGDMHYTIKEVGIDDDLMVIAGDNLYEYKLAQFHKFFREKKASVVACKDMENIEEVREKFGVVDIDKAGKIIGFEEKPKNPKSALAATACYIFSREDVREISKYIDFENPPDNAGDFVKWLANHKSVYAFVFREKWFDIGSFENLGKAREEFNG